MEVELKNDNTVCVRVRENDYKMIANSYSNTQMDFEGFIAGRGSSPGECCISPASSTGFYREKLWDLHVEAERDVSQINY